VHSPYCNAMYFPRPDRWLLCPFDVCSMCSCNLTLDKANIRSPECSLQHPADGYRKLVRFQSSFFYMFAFRTLRYVLKKYSMCDLPTHYTVRVTLLHIIQYVWPSYTLYSMCDLYTHYTVCVTFLHTIQYVWPSYTLYHRQKSLQRKRGILS
jgi:hypothetical protein